MEGKGKTLEGESPLLKDGGNAEKPLLTRFCVAKSVISPSKPPSLTENFPQEHPLRQSENLFRFAWCGCSWGKFLFRAGGEKFLHGTASRPVGGWEAGDKGAGGNLGFPPAVLFISFRYRICFRQNKLQYRSIPNTLLNMLSTVLLFRCK